MGKVSAFFDRWLGRGSAVWSFGGPIVPGTLGAVVTGYLSSWVSWISQWGAFGWWCAALAGGIATSVIYVAGAVARDLYSTARSKEKWAREVDSINPMDKVFHGRRIRLADLVHPIRKNIKDKNFADCELIGPANIVFRGNGHFTDGLFLNCDVVIMKDGDVTLNNVVILENCTITRCEIFEVTLIVPPQMYLQFAGMFPEPMTVKPTLLGAKNG
jgi:hypothetical protein